MPAGLPRPRVERTPQAVLDTELVSDTVSTAIDAELLRKHADHDHDVSGASVYEVLQQNLGDVWVLAYVGGDAQVLETAVVKRLQALTRSSSASKATLEKHLREGAAPVVAPLFVGQRVWAKWLGERNNVESGWCAARVLGVSEPGRNGARTYHVYFDIDRKEHPRLPIKKSGHAVIRVDDPGV